MPEKVLNRIHLIGYMYHPIHDASGKISNKRELFHGELLVSVSTHDSTIKNSVHDWTLKMFKEKRIEKTSTCTTYKWDLAVGYEPTQIK